MTAPIAQTLQAFCTRLDLDPAVLGTAMWNVSQAYGTTDVMEPLDTPLVSEQEWLRQVTESMATDSGVDVQLPSLGAAWFDGRETNAAWSAALRRLREAGTFVGMLSNMPPSWDVYWRAMAPPDEHFDDVVLSFEVGHRKPDREIFEVAARRAGADARDCVLVDDLEKNCAGAEAAGWRSVHFTDAATAEVELARLLGSS